MCVCIAAQQLQELEGGKAVPVDDITKGKGSVL